MDFLAVDSTMLLLNILGIELTYCWDQQSVMKSSTSKVNESKLFAMRWMVHDCM